MAPLGFPYKLMLLEPTKSCAMPTMVSDSDSRKQREKRCQKQKNNKTQLVSGISGMVRLMCRHFFNIQNIQSANWGSERGEKITVRVSDGGETGCAPRTSRHDGRQLVQRHSPPTAPT